MKTTVWLLLSSMIVLMVGCRTTAIRNPEPITIPPGLTAKDAKAAMVLAISPRPVPDGENWEKIVDSLLSARFWSYKSQFQAEAGWFIESVEPEAVVFGYHRRAHYLRVRMEISATTVSPRIDGSSNLEQTKTSIHENALEWADELAITVRAALGRVSALKANSGDVSKTQ
ncbi:hypothetical protein DB347_24475 [Opitutaceae bacterium EW11]|nr:hypothetical protein DB347_24475 [Opitutaceae bacterium EW11]